MRPESLWRGHGIEPHDMANVLPVRQQKQVGLGLHAPAGSLRLASGQICGTVRGQCCALTTGRPQVFPTGFPAYVHRKLKASAVSDEK